MREKATFFKENILPLQEAGQLYCIDKDQTSFENIEFLLADGHTEKMIMPKIQYQEKHYYLLQILFLRQGIFLCLM
jgi:hypothetical protein